MEPRRILALAIAAAVVIVACLCEAHATVGLGLFGIGMTLLAPNVRDASHVVTKALPNGAADIYTDGIDLGGSAQAQFAGGHACELLIEAPALATADLGDAATMKYEVQHDTDSAFGTAKSLYGVVLTQTGAGGAGAAAASKRVALPTDVKRYVRVKATNSAAGDASDKSVTVSLVF